VNLSLEGRFFGAGPGQDRSCSADEVARLLDSYRNYLRFLAREAMGRAMRVNVGESDLAQEVIIRAQAKFGQFHGKSEGELLAWLRTILAHRLVDLARKYKRDLEHREAQWAIDESSIALIRLGSLSQPSPIVSAERAEDTARIADALALLDPDHREVILLRTRDGLSWNEVGEAMDRSSAAARQLWVRALRAMRPHLEEPS